MRERGEITFVEERKVREKRIENRLLDAAKKVEMDKTARVLARKVREKRLVAAKNNPLSELAKEVELVEANEVKARAVAENFPIRSKVLALNGDVWLPATIVRYNFKASRGDRRRASRGEDGDIFDVGLTFKNDTKCSEPGFDTDDRTERGRPIYGKWVEEIRPAPKDLPIGSKVLGLYEHPEGGLEWLPAIIVRYNFNWHDLEKPKDFEYRGNYTFDYGIAFNHHPDRPGYVNASSHETPKFGRSANEIRPAPKAAPRKGARVEVLNTARVFKCQKGRFQRVLSSGKCDLYFDQVKWEVKLDNGYTHCILAEDIRVIPKKWWHFWKSQ